MDNGNTLIEHSMCYCKAGFHKIQVDTLQDAVVTGRWLWVVLQLLKALHYITATAEDTASNF